MASFGLSVVPVDKGKNASMSKMGLNSNRGAKQNEFSTFKGGNMVTTTNSFDVLRSLEVDPATHNEPSNPKDNTRRTGLVMSNVQVNEDCASDVEEVNDETAHFMASKNTKEGSGI
ncbi:hypothetical protein Tco_1231055, partial [Tanacetum coccineum]